MPFRKTLFWCHLCAGVAAGLFVLLMSVTGVLLTYEHDMQMAVRNNAKTAWQSTDARLSLDELTNIAADISETRDGVSLTIDRDPKAPVLVQKRGRDVILLDPYTGQQLEDPAKAMDAFFSYVVRLHRWLAMTGDSRDTGRAITGAANLTFLFLVISGLYLWLPKVWRWSFIKLNLFFRRNLPTSKARDYNWHYVFGVWALIPLFFIVLSGVIISYSWAGNLVYKLAGEDVPQRRGPPPAQQAEEVAIDASLTLLSQEDALENILVERGGKWKSLRVSLPETPEAPLMSVAMNYGSGVTPNQRETHIYDRSDARIQTTETADEASLGRKLRIWFRFIHTGQQYGLIGQTIAGLASLAACFLVYTGLALSFRRLILPLFRRRKKPA